VEEKQNEPGLCSDSLTITITGQSASNCDAGATIAEASCPWCRASSVKSQ
jgi:hypothetical protein